MELGSFQPKFPGDILEGDDLALFYLRAGTGNAGNAVYFDAAYP